MTQGPNAFRDFEHQGWQKAAAQYGRGFGVVTVQAIDALLAAAGVEAGVRVLDVACGPGYVAAAAAARGASVVAVDFSSEMVELARIENPTLEFHEGDAENLAFPDASFDAVVMNFGMLHLGNPEHAAAEAFRVLRPGGRYAFTVWDVPEKAIGFGIVLQSIQAHGNMNVPLPAGPPFFRFSNPDESARMLSAVGFADVRVVQIPQVWTMPSGEGLFTTMRRAAVRTAALLNMQTPDALEAIRRAILERTEQFRTSTGIILPMPAILSYCNKPRSGARV